MRYHECSYIVSVRLSFITEKYDPDIRAMLGVFLGSMFILSLFLAAPDFSNPYYLIGIIITVLVIGFSATILIQEAGE